VGNLHLKQLKKKNKYSPTSTIGVGWSLSNPKIIVDNKQTAAQDDDVFYLIDGKTRSKLICVKKEDPMQSPTNGDVISGDNNGTVWEFKLEKYAPWIIKLHRGVFSSTYVDLFPGPPPYFRYEFQKLDYWSIIKDDGLTYYYGFNSSPNIGVDIPSSGKSKESVQSWGNWIGDSKYLNHGQKNTLIWNLSRIEDQWNNTLDFEYELQEIQVNAKQTEASYLKKITSSKGASIHLTYGNKNCRNSFHFYHN